MTPFPLGSLAGPGECEAPGKQSQQKAKGSSVRGQKRHF